MHFFGILGIILKIKLVYFFYILPKLLLRIIHFKNLIRLYIIFYQSDASIKKLNNIYIAYDVGYELNGTMIGYNILTVPNNFVINDKYNYIGAFQYKDKIYAIYGYTVINGFTLTRYNSYANIVYI